MYLSLIDTTDAAIEATSFFDEDPKVTGSVYF